MKKAANSYTHIIMQSKIYSHKFYSSDVQCIFLLQLRGKRITAAIGFGKGATRIRRHCIESDFRRKFC